MHVLKYLLQELLQVSQVLHRLVCLEEEDFDFEEGLYPELEVEVIVQLVVFQKLILDQELAIEIGPWGTILDFVFLPL